MGETESENPGFSRVHILLSSFLREVPNNTLTLVYIVHLLDSIPTIRVPHVIYNLRKKKGTTHYVQNKEKNDQIRT